MNCPHCDNRIAKYAESGGVKIRTSIVVLHKSGSVEINCPSCKQAILIPRGATPTIGVRKP